MVRSIRPETEATVISPIPFASRYSVAMRFCSPWRETASVW